MDEDEQQTISVQELLARMGQGETAPVQTGRSRRHRAHADSISVSELTGEIPVIREKSTHTHRAEPETKRWSGWSRRKDPDAHHDQRDREWDFRVLSGEIERIREDNPDATPPTDDNRNEDLLGGPSIYPEDPTALREVWGGAEQPETPSEDTVGETHEFDSRQSEPVQPPLPDPSSALRDQVTPDAVEAPTVQEISALEEPAWSASAEEDHSEVDTDTVHKDPATSSTDETEEELSVSDGSVDEESTDNPYSFGETTLLSTAEEISEDTASDSVGIEHSDVEEHTAQSDPDAPTSDFLGQDNNPTFEGDAVESAEYLPQSEIPHAPPNIHDQERDSLGAQTSSAESLDTHWPTTSQWPDTPTATPLSPSNYPGAVNDPDGAGFVVSDPLSYRPQQYVDPAASDYRAPFSPFGAEPTQYEPAAQQGVGAAPYTTGFGDVTASDPKAHKRISAFKADRLERAREIMEKRKAEGQPVHRKGILGWVDSVAALRVPAWASVTLQFVTGFLLGALLFWTFRQLWNLEEPIFTSVLAIIVIAFLVVSARFIQRKNDWTSLTLIGIIGAWVCFGPLIVSFLWG